MFKCNMCAKRQSPETSIVSDELSASLAQDGQKIASTQEDLEVRDLVRELCRKIDGLSEEVRSLRSDNQSLRTHLARNTDLLLRCLAADETCRERQDALTPTASEVLQPNATVLSSTKDWPTVSEAHKRPPGGEPTASRASERTPGEEPRQRVSFSQMVRLPSSDERRRGQPEMRRGFSGVNGSNSLPAFSDQQDYTGADRSKRVVDADGFQQVLQRRRTTASVGSCKASKLRVVAKPPRKKALFVSRLHPDTSCDDLGEIVSSVLESSDFSCTKLPSRFDTYASFHVSVHEDDFEKIACPELWPAGCLFRPFFGRLRVDDERSSAKSIQKPGEGFVAPLDF